MRRFVITFVLALCAAAPVSAAAEAPIHVFVREGCVHCADEKTFLADLAARRPSVAVQYHDIADPAERERFDRLVELLQLSKSTPLTFIGGRVLQGFATPDSTGVQLEAMLDAAADAAPTLDAVLAGDAVATLFGTASGCDESGETPCVVEESAWLIPVPFIGTVDARRYSLPALAAILGTIDGFNPCAMWVLITFLIVLLQLPDRRRVWQIAGLFVLAEAVMYYLILNVWFTTWDFIGLDQIVTPIVGVLAIGGGGFFLWEGAFSDGTCKVTNLEQRRRTHQKIRDIALRPFTLLTAVGVIGLALSVNVIEFACSIGIPQAFTKILEINDLSALHRHGLMGIYILGYMIDDFLVFGLAIWSAEKIHATHKYSRVSNIIGGVLMVALGLLLLLKPEALMAL